MAALVGETGMAMPGVGRKVIGTIQGHQALGVQVAQRRPHAVRFQARKNLETHRVESAWRDRIEQRTDLMIPGNLLHSQQRVDVIVALGLLQGALGGQK